MIYKWKALHETEAVAVGSAPDMYFLWCDAYTMKNKCFFTPYVVVAERPLDFV